MSDPATPDLGEAASRLKKLLAVCGAAVAPIVAAFAGVAPPWPPGVAKLSAMLVVLVLVLAWPLTAGAGPVWRQRAIWIAGAVCLASFGCYLGLFSTFVFRVPTAAETSVVLGCGLTDDARGAAAVAHIDLGSGCPGNFRQLLDASQYEPGEIWTQGSILTVQIALFASFLLTLSALSVAVFTFVAGQAPARPPAKAKRAPRKPATPTG